MPSVTISEALGQIQSIDQQIARKQQLIETYLLRDASLRDPFQKDGGTPGILAREMASIQTLLERKILIRRAVQAGNERAHITHADETRTVADWLVWKREVLARRSEFLRACRNRIDQARALAAQLARQAGERTVKNDVVVHLKENDLAGEMELLEERQGFLAGQFSLRNATTAVDLPGDETWQTGLEPRFDELLGRPSTPEPAVQASGLSVWFDGLPDPVKKISVIKAVREVTGLGLAEAKNLVEGPPRVIRANLSYPDADWIRQRLQDAGANVSVR